MIKRNVANYIDKIIWMSVCLCVYMHQYQKNKRKLHLQISNLISTKEKIQTKLKFKDCKFLQFNQKTLIDTEFLIHTKLIEEIHLQKSTT